ncbi:MAG: sarcosine oxidase subunit delta [Pseudomonadota bacterium]
MLVIPCPWCGDRHESEFICGGPTRPARPEGTDQLTDGEWVAHLTVSPNPAGFLSEKWWHAHGCGLWFTLERNTVTHEVRAISNEDDRGEEA